MPYTKKKKKNHHNRVTSFLVHTSHSSFFFFYFYWHLPLSGQYTSSPRTHINPIHTPTSLTIFSTSNDNHTTLNSGPTAILQFNNLSNNGHTYSHHRPTVSFLTLTSLQHSCFKPSPPKTSKLASKSTAKRLYAKHHVVLPTLRLRHQHVRNLSWCRICHVW